LEVAQVSSTVSKSAFVSAPVEKIMQVILDVEAYPSWQKEMEKVVVLSQDSRGRPELAGITEQSEA
jgi:hypothetical protein